MSRVSPVKPSPESRRGRATHRRIKRLRDVSNAPLAFALKVSFQFCNETAWFGPLPRLPANAMCSVQDD